MESAKRVGWEWVVSESQQSAIRSSLEYAQCQHKRSVACVADQVGVNVDEVYQWLAVGSMPSNKICGFESACGIDYVTSHLAYSGNRILVDIPVEVESHFEVLALRYNFTDIVKLLVSFYHSEIDAEETIETISAVISDLSSQCARVDNSEALTEVQGVVRTGEGLI